MCDNTHTHGALFSGGHMGYCNFSLQLWQVAVLVIFREPKFCSLVVICLVKFNKQLILYVKNYALFQLYITAIILVIFSLPGLFHVVNLLSFLCHVTNALLSTYVCVWHTVRDCW